MRLRECKNVVLIDDDPAAAGHLAEMFAEQHVSNTTVVQLDSIDAIEYFIECEVDMLLVDPCSSQGQNIGLVKEIRKVAPWVAIVVLTSLNEDGAAASALRDGAQDYLIKGQIDSYDLVRALNYAIERKVLEEALFIEKERAQVTLASIGDAVVCVDVDANVTFVNAAAERLTGWSSREAVGRSTREVIRIISAQDNAFIPDPMELSLRLDRIVHLPLDSILVRRDEIEIPVEDSAAPIHDRNGRLIGAVMVMRDVSAARASASLLANSASEIANQYALVNRVNSELAAIFNSSPMAIYATDPDGLVTMWSPAAESMSGFSRNEALGRFLPTVPDNAIEEAKVLIREICDGRRISSMILTSMRKDGTEIALGVSAGPLVDSSGRVFGALYISENVTETQSERRRIERMQSEFVSTVSHELRTPLTSIGGSLGLIAGGAVGVLGSQAARLVTIAYENTQRLSRLVNDILDIERLQSSGVQFNFALVFVDGLVGQAIAALLSYAAKFGIELYYIDDRCDCFIRADPDRIVQAVTNLISNAIKFSPKNARVDISTECVQDSVRISVRDYGAGIPERFHSRIFQRFSQDDSSNERQKDGSGLGLSIVREIMERHGGSVSFETALSVGSTFYLQFPAIETPPDDARQAEPDVSPNRVLINALDEVKYNLICCALQAHGFASTAALTEEQAFRAAANGTAVAAIIELPFPGRDLGSFIRSLRRYRKNNDFPVMLLCVEPSVWDNFRDMKSIPIFDWAAKLAKPQGSQPTVNTHMPRRSGKPAILHIEDQPYIRNVLRRALGVEFRLIAAPTIDVALHSLAKAAYDLVIVDWTLLADLGTDLVSAIAAAPGYPILTVTFTGKGSFLEPDEAINRTAIAKSRINLSILATGIRSALSRTGREYS